IMSDKRAQNTTKFTDEKDMNNPGRSSNDKGVDDKNDFWKDSQKIMEKESNLDYDDKCTPMTFSGIDTQVQQGQVSSGYNIPENIENTRKQGVYKSGSAQHTSNIKPSV